MIRIIGVAGRICSGKSELTSILRDCGFREIDVDAVGHAVLQDEVQAVAEAFGDDVLTGEGMVDRRALGRRVFTDRAALERLEAIVHPPMVARVRSEIDSLPGDARIVINAALLFHMGLHTVCDHAIVVRAWAPVRFLRAWRRDRHGIRSTIARFRQQRSLSLSAEQVDISIVGNSVTRGVLRRRVRGLLRELHIDC